MDEGTRKEDYALAGEEFSFQDHYHPHTTDPKFIFSAPNSPLNSLTESSPLGQLKGIPNLIMSKMTCYLPHTSVPPSVFPISVKSTVLYYLLINCSIYHACNPLESRNVAVIFLVMLVTQPCPALCNIMDCSLPGCYVYGILQTRTLEWVAISFSRGSSCSRDQTWVSCIAGEFFTV